MAMPVSASRFACLPDDFLDDKIKPVRKPKKDANNDFAFLNDSSGKNKSNKNKKPATEADKLRQDAFAAGGGKKKGKKGKNKNNTSVNSEASGSKSQNEMSPPPTSAAASPPKTDVPNTQQFQEWKQSDTKNVEDAFERDIEQALMLSMIEAEHDKEIAREREAAKAAIPKKTMSLDEFNRSLESAGSPPSTNGSSKNHHQRGSSGQQAHPPPLVGVGSSAGRVGTAPTSLAELRLMEQQQIQQKADFFSEVDHGAKKIVNRRRSVSRFTRCTWTWQPRKNETTKRK